MTESVSSKSGGKKGGKECTEKGGREGLLPSRLGLCSGRNGKGREWRLGRERSMLDQAVPPIIPPHTTKNLETTQKIIFP